MPLWQRCLAWRERLRVIKVAENLLVAVSLPVLLTLGRRGAIGNSIPNMLQSITSLSSSLSIGQVGTPPKFLDQGMSITPMDLWLIWLRVTIFQLRSHPSLICNFKWFSVKAAQLIIPLSKKEVDELLAKGATEPSSSGAGFLFQCLCCS